MEGAMLDISDECSGLRRYLFSVEIEKCIGSIGGKRQVERL
jgi:hypothetical protein